MRWFNLNNLMNISCLLFFSLFLCIKSGYSIGALLCLTASIFLLFKKGCDKLNGKDYLVICFLLISAYLWGYGFDGLFNYESYHTDEFFKYIFSIIIFLALIRVCVLPGFYIVGIALGCCGACLIALYQFPLTGRAEGFTNAIRFGNISFWMGIVCFIFCFYLRESKTKKIILFLAGLSGILASALSLSRGGWIALIALPFIFYFIEDKSKKRFRIFVASCVGVVLVALAASNFSFIEKRVAGSISEVQGYLNGEPGSAETSVGARLEQWRLAWIMSKEKPITGWGEYGYLKGREEFAAQGLADASVVNFGHAHNEYFNILAKKGVVGVLALTLIYVLPFLAFRPNFNLMLKLNEKELRLYKSFCAVGMLIPLSYFIFGLTEYFFYLNIGHIFYIFSILFTYSIVKSLERVSE